MATERAHLLASGRLPRNSFPTSDLQVRAFECIYGARVTRSRVFLLYFDSLGSVPPLHAAEENYR